MTCARLRLVLFVIAAGVLVAGCDSSDDDSGTPPTASGLNYAQSTQGVGATFEAITSVVGSQNPDNPIRVPDGGFIDHASNAQRAGLNLRPTRVVLFSNPEFSTPLIATNQSVALDLPQKILVYRNAEEDVYAAYNTTDYLDARHGLGTPDAFTNIEAALRALTRSATGGNISGRSASDVAENEGITPASSDLSVDETFENLQAAVESNENLEVVTDVDFQSDAEGVGMTLRPTRLLVFGNPSLGTRLMQEQQSIGIDLPQKMLVYEDEDGNTSIAYNDPDYLAERHGIAADSVRTTLNNIETALSNLAQAAGSSGDDG